MHPYDTISDDFGVTVHLASKVEMPSNRETVVHLFESVRKQYPKMTDFERRDGGEYVLEEDRESGSYRWITIDGRRLILGASNPPTLDDADQHNEWVLEMAPYHLNLGGLDTEYLDVMYFFDFQFTGNHDEVVAEALASGGPFEPVAKYPPARMLHYQPSMTMALDENCQMQFRVNVETRSTAYQVRTGNYTESPITVYCTVRQFWGRQPDRQFVESYRNQRRLLDELATDLVIPNIVQPLAKVIATRS